MFPPGFPLKTLEDKAVVSRTYADGDAALGERIRDLHTKNMEEFGIRAVKDYISLDEFRKYENQSEDKVKAVRRPAQEFAKKFCRKF